MTSARTIEQYVDEIVDNITELEYDNLEEVYSTLQRMKFSTKTKHELNYWRVMQCMGEVAVDKLIEYLVKSERNSCKCHMYSNLCCVMKLFVAGLSNVVVIKRVVFFTARLGPVFFKAIRQPDDHQLTKLGFEAMYKCMLVGKTDVAENFLKYGVMKDIYQHVKLKNDTEQFSYVAISSVLCCTNLLLTITECGTDSMRKQVRRSFAVRVLAEYIVKLRKAKVIKTGVMALCDTFSKLKNVMSDDKLAQQALEQWKSKEKLREALEQDLVYAFCSSPNCRKIYTEKEKFRYCGACRLARYCSEKCQKDHWKKAHKDACLHEPSEIQV